MGKVLLIMGASSDCGIAIIKKVHNNYSHIYAHYAHHAEQLQKIREEIGDKLILIQDDFSLENSGQAILDIIEKRGEYPDHIIHLPAPNYQNYKFVKAGWTPFEHGIQTSLHSCVTVLQGVIPKMIKEKREGRIIFMLSSYTNNNPPRFTAPYVTVKYALLGLMKELSVEYADKGIMVNGISPGMMETKFLKDVPELIVQQNAGNSPFGRNLNIEEVVPLFEFLLSDEAARITGQNIIISGGM